jgi:hypothetical protein
MQVLSLTPADVIATGAGKLMVLTLEFDQLEPGNVLCVAIENLSPNPLACASVKKYPLGLSGSFGYDAKTASDIGTLSANGSPGDRIIVEQAAFAYKAVQYTFTAVAKADQLHIEASVGVPR